MSKVVTPAYAHAAPAVYGGYGHGGYGHGYSSLGKLIIHLGRATPVML